LSLKYALQEEKMQIKGVIILAICFWLGGSFSKANVVEAKGMQVSELAMTITAYYKPLPNQEDYILDSYEEEVKMNGIGEETKSGSVPKRGTLAADTDIFPNGTMFHIPGYGQGTVEDIGAAIKGQRLDLFMGEGDVGRKKAIAWGRRDVKVRIISKV
jgi:3D (Asp-Asp-Asp) domain-containing protein